MESCPKCHLHLEDPDAAECPFCGVVFARLRPNRVDEPKTLPAPEIREEQIRNDASRDALFADAEAIAQLYRRLVLLVGSQLLLGFLRAPMERASSPGASLLSLLVLVALLGLLVAITITAYKLAAHLGTGLPILWAIAMFLPCLNVIFLLMLSSQAQAWCRRYGIKVGFWGPTTKSIEEFRRRTLSSTFD